MATLWSGYQEEHLELAMLLQLSMEDGRMEDGRLLVGLVTTPYFPGMFRGRELSGLYFRYEASLYCRSTFHHYESFDMGQLVISPPVD